LGPGHVVAGRAMEDGQAPPVEGRMRRPRVQPFEIFFSTKRDMSAGNEIVLPELELAVHRSLFVVVTHAQPVPAVEMSWITG
jgi:hypothetical protein